MSKERRHPPRPITAGCGARAGVFLCNEDPDHGGDHISVSNVTGKELHRWRE